MGNPWYRDGLRFDCTRCGHCCTGSPGYVWVHRREIRELVDFHRSTDTSMTFDKFSRRFVRKVEGRYALIERKNGDCIFWSEGTGCTVYAARPLQCRTFPFWREHLGRARDWEALKDSCPGVGEGKLYPLEEIQIIRRGENQAGEG